MDKNDLSFGTPLMNAAGMLGFAPDPRAVLNTFPSGTWADLGVFVTNPLSLRARRPVNTPQQIDYPGGILLHAGLPNPGFSAVLKKYARRWASTRMPVIVHVMADGPEETARMVRMLEGLENIGAVELGFSVLQAADGILATLELAQGELPLIANLALNQVLSLGPQAVQHGAAALSFAAPRGTLPGQVPLDPDEAWSMISGRLYGPGLYPQSLSLLRSAVRLGLPVIGGVGVYTQDQADAMLASGALAVQLDVMLWK
ncbi:MAG: hypothetical protein WCK35_25130 [Chloroflexota bacterium]